MSAEIDIKILKQALREAKNIIDTINENAVAIQNETMSSSTAYCVARNRSLQLAKSLGWQAAMELIDGE